MKLLLVLFMLLLLYITVVPREIPVFTVVCQRKDVDTLLLLEMGYRKVNPNRYEAFFKTWDADGKYTGWAMSVVVIEEPFCSI